MACAENKVELRKASKLSDVQNLKEWYSLQFPELQELRPRVGHSLISLEPGKVLIIGGGNHEGALQDIFEVDLDPADDSESRVKDHPVKSLFPPKYEFLCAKDKSDKIWIFGGADTESTSNEVIVIGGEVLEKVKCSGSESLENSNNANINPEPCPRTQGSNSAIVERDGKEYLAIFAGGLKGEQPVSDRDLYLFDIASHEWESVKVNIDEKLQSKFPFGCQPPAVQGHLMTAHGSKILVHGGMTHTTLYDGFHCMDLNEKSTDSNSLHSWTDCSINYCAEQPEGRAAHGVAKVSDVDKTSKVIYVFGGLGQKGPCNDLWTFDFESMGWTRILENRGEESYTFYPMPRLDFGMCAIGGKDTTTGESSVYIMIHGGMSLLGELYNDAWVMKIR